jgi:hypothetical protein
MNTTDYISDRTPIARPSRPLNWQPFTSPSPSLGRHGRKNSRADQARISIALSKVMKEIEEEAILESDSGSTSLPSQDKQASVSGQAHTVRSIDISIALRK